VGAIKTRFENIKFSVSSGEFRRIGSLKLPSIKRNGQAEIRVAAKVID